MQPVVDGIDFTILQIVVGPEPAWVTGLVPTLQVAFGDPQEPAGKVTGMPMTFKATVVPQPVHVDAGSRARR